MPEKNPLRLWKEAVSSQTRLRDTFRGMHLAVLHQAVQDKRIEELSSLRFDTQDFVLYELKGCPVDLCTVELPISDRETLWLCVVFHGRMTFADGHVRQSDTIFSFKSGSEDIPITIAAEKIWVLFLGISGVARQQMLGEYPLLRQHYGTETRAITPARSITYVDRQILEQFSKLSFGPFTTLYHVGQLLGKLYASYTRQLAMDKEPGKDEVGMLLYHRAIAYIQENYLDVGLNRMTIAEALHCSTRNLSRAFEGRTHTLNSSILQIRLHKGRELLRSQPDLTVDEIAARLHFPSAKYFATRYKSCFHCTPREERKNISDWKIYTARSKRRS